MGCREVITGGEERVLRGLLPFFYRRGKVAGVKRSKRSQSSGFGMSSTR